MRLTKARVQGYRNINDCFKRDINHNIIYNINN